MKKILILILALLIAGVAYAAIPPSAQMQIFYEEKSIDGDITAEFLDCYEENADYGRGINHQPVAPELASINEYDEENNCTWRPMDYLRSGTCRVSMCEFFPIPWAGARFAVYVHDLDRTFITDEIDTHTDRHYFWVFLKEDGSATIEETGRINMAPFYASYEDEYGPFIDEVTTKYDSLPGWMYILILGILAAIGLGIGLLISKRSASIGRRRRRR